MVETNHADRGTGEKETVENTDAKTYSERRNEDCPENGHSLTGHHGYEYELDVNDEIAVRATCSHCGEFLGEWDTEEKAIHATREMDIGECPGCNEVAWVNQGGGRTVDGEVWHESCWYKTKYDGFEDTDGDAPIARNPNRPYNLHRTVTTEIDGQVFKWDEYLYTRMYQDHGRHNLPTRDELTTGQLETLREWAVGENPTADGLAYERDFPVGVFPAKFVLLGGYKSDFPEKWICPDCGEIVEAKRQEPVEGPADVTRGVVDIEAECGNCGSDRWLTAGEPIEESVPDALAPLSDREHQAVMLDILGGKMDKEKADALGVEVSTFREYRARAKEKAKEGKRLYDKLESLDVIDE